MSEKTGFRNKGKKISLDTKAATYPYKEDKHVAGLLYEILK